MLRNKLGNVALVDIFSQCLEGRVAIGPILETPVRQVVKERALRQDRTPHSKKPIEGKLGMCMVEVDVFTNLGKGGGQVDIEPFGHGLQTGYKPTNRRKSLHDGSVPENSWQGRPTGPYVDQAQILANHR